MITNFRDISKFNSKIRKSVIFRSSALGLHKDNIQVKEILTNYNIKTIIDLRAEREIINCNYNKEFKNIYSVINAPFDPWKQSIKFQNTYNYGTNVEIAYRFFAMECKQSIKKIVKTIINSNEAIIIHCHAGKDRTGIVVALFHLLSGANKDEIFLDYLASKMDTKKSYLQIILDIVKETGGVKKYLQTCELSKIQIDELKNILCK